MKKIIRFVKEKGFRFLKWLYHYSGAKHIRRKFKPNKLGILPTGPIWIIGIYIALFGISSQRYENRIDIIENRANAIFAQLGTPARKKAMAKIPRVQKMLCPIKPEIWNPVSVVTSFISENYYPEIREHLKETVEIWKSDLDSVDLSSADLYGADLFEADLSCADLSGTNLSRAKLIGTDLSFADLSGANLYSADLSGANLRGADLSGANLWLAYLSGADLSRADLSGAYLFEAYLFEAYLSGANLYRATGLTKDQLLKVNTLYKVKGLDEELRKQLEKEVPHLFEKPEWYTEPDEDE